MFVGGIMGKFISILPVAVISALLVSLVECLIMLPAHLSALPDPNDAERIRRQQRNPLRRVRRSISEGLEYFVHHIYMPFLAKALTYRYAVIAIALMVLMLTVGLFRGGIVQYVMFPDIDGNTMTATIEFPNGTPIERTGRAVERMERAVEELAEQTPTESGEPLVEHMYSLVGGSLAENPSGELLTGGLPHTGSVRVELLESADRGVHSKVLMDRWQEIIGKAPGAVSLSIEGMEGGPPGKPIEIWIQGQNMDQILLAADQAVKRLQKFEGVSQIQSDFRPGKNEIRFALKPEARTMGLTVADLARQLNAGFFGEEAMRLQRGRDDIRVRVRYPEAERKRLSDLENVRIRTPQGHELPLSAVADLKYGPGYAGITRTDGMRRVAVTADVNTEIANTEEIVNTLAYGHPQGARFAEGPSFFDELRQQYPGIRVALEGEKRDSAESLGSLMVGFPLALIGIFVIIATMFRSYLQPLIIMVTVPFGMIGAVLGHVIMGMDVTLISMFGIVALAGVVVNDAIVLIECVNEYTANKIPFFEALARAGARRFRAILLTTLSTVGGLAPMILETDLQAQFLKPMAVSIAAGVAFATLLTLLLVPCLLGILNDFRRVARRLTTGEWPDANDVEPARHRADDSAELAILPETSTYIPENTEEAPGRPAAAGFSGNGNGRRSRRGAEAEGVPAGGGRRRTAAGSSARGTGSRRAASAARDEALSAGRTGNGANNRR
jgi:multidrug efflux pump subunit AcrB